MNSNRLRPDPVLETQCFALPWSSGALSIVIAHLERLELVVMLQRHLPSNRNELHVCCTFSHKGVSSPTTPNRMLPVDSRGQYPKDKRSKEHDTCVDSPLNSHS